MKTRFTLLITFTFACALHAQNVPFVEATRLWTTGQALNVTLENEGFEAGLGNFTNSGVLNWTTTNTEAYAGTQSATSNTVFAGQNAILNLNVFVPLEYTAVVRFYLLADTSQGPDMIDDVRIGFKIDGITQSNTIIDTNWTQKTYFLSDGNHVLAWEVFHVAPGSDDEVQVYLDQVVIDYNRRPAFRMADGSEGFGKVLMSDVHGNASWQTLGAMTQFDNSNGNFLLPLTLDGRHQILNPFKVVNGNGNGIQSSSNGLNGFYAINNAENGFRASNNAANGFEALNNQMHGFRAFSNDSSGFYAEDNLNGFISVSNLENGFNAQNNGLNGFYAEGNDNGFSAQSNALNGFSASGNFRGFDARNNTDDGFLAIYNSGHGVVSAGNEDGGFKAEENSDDGFEASGNTGRGFYATMNTTDGYHASDNGGDGFEAQNNTGHGVYVHSNTGNGVYAWLNTGDGVLAFDNSENGFTADANDDNGFESSNNGGYGVFAFNNGGDGVYTSQNDGDGVVASTNSGDGFYAINNTGDGLYAIGNGNGVYAYNNNFYGVRAHASLLDGIYSHTNTGDEGYFSGTVTVTGNLTKGGGSFKIDHPLDPENKFLYHSFVESPDMMNVYNGNVLLDANGEAIVQMEAWFQPLNRDFRYQLTALGAPGPDLHIAEEIRDNQFRIAGGTPGMKVSWQVTGIRQDPYANHNRIEVEVEKPAEFKGYFLHPEVYDRPFEKGFDYVKLGYKTLEEIHQEATQRSKQ